MKQYIIFDFYVLNNRIVNFQDWSEAEFIGVLDTTTQARTFSSVFLLDQHLLLNKRLSKILLKLPMRRWSIILK